MCTSLISNRNKTIVGYNLDIIDTECCALEDDEGVFAEINNPKDNIENIIMLDIDLLLQEIL